jgi:hypothetical protein
VSPARKPMCDGIWRIGGVSSTCTHRLHWLISAESQSVREVPRGQLIPPASTEFPYYNYCKLNRQTFGLRTDGSERDAPVNRVTFVLTTAFLYTNIEPPFGK